MSLIKEHFHGRVMVKGCYKLLLTLLLLVGLQQTSDKQVYSTDCIIFALAQRFDKLLQVLLQVAQEECCRVSDCRLDDVRRLLQIQSQSMTPWITLHAKFPSISAL